mmetsp:Transcript_25964/g.32330  ORF Transcript_25964/g.32330 Transcript_25964/m.32330 type:complete len:90 (-) Transcript_25964:105-374(-)
MILSRSNVPLKSNEARFRCSQNLTKHEIQEYMGKLYRMPFKNNEMPHTTNHMGKIMMDHGSRRQWRRKDYKRVTVRLEYDIDPDFQKIQ